MAIDLSRFARWGIRQESFDDDGKALTRLELKHIKEGTRSACIHEVKLPRNEDQTWEDIGREIEYEADQDASGLQPGVHSYAVLAYRGKAAPVARFAFRILSGESESDGSSLSEGPTAAGLTSQSMRHVELLMRSTAMAWADMQKGMLRQIHAYQEREARLAETQLRTFELQEKLISQHQQRELEYIKSKHTAELMSEGADMVRAWGPTFMSLMARKAGLQLPASKEHNPTITNLRELLKTISPDQLDALQATLMPHQKLQFFEVYESLMNEAVEQEEKAEEKEGLIEKQFEGAKPPNGTS